MQIPCITSLSQLHIIAYHVCTFVYFQGVLLYILSLVIAPLQPGYVLVIDGGSTGTRMCAFDPIFVSLQFKKKSVLNLY